MTHDSTPRHVIEVGDGFWNIRGSFKIGGVVDVGTQASLVRRANGRYVLLDACSFDEATKRWIDTHTHGGDDVDAVINVHPFHTVFVRQVKGQFPRAKLYGTARHAARLADLSWEKERVEEPAFHQLYADDFDFSVPRGAELIPANENLHFGSVLVFHRASKTLHVDDTFSYIRLPKLIRPLKEDLMMVHPTLAKVLERRAGAAEDFRGWSREVVELAADSANLCAAHSAALLGRENGGPSIAERLQTALTKVEGKLQAHERKYG